MKKYVVLVSAALLITLLGCKIFADPLQQRVQETDKISADAILVSDLYAHPKKYTKFVGQPVTVVGYLDFANIHDQRKNTYPQEAIALITKPEDPGSAQSVFAYFAPAANPYPLFDLLYDKENRIGDKGLAVAVQGTLQSFERQYNFNSDTGFVLEGVIPDDVSVLD